MQSEANEDFGLKSWFASATVPSFVVQLLIATLGSIVTAIILVVIVAILIAAVTPNSSGGNFADHLADGRVFFLVDEPYYIAPVLIAFCLGFLARRFFRNRTGGWVWVVPAFFLLAGILSWQNGGYRPYWPDVWNNYFGSDCGSSECLYEFFVTAPFYTSVAYTFGWVGKGLLQVGRGRW